MQNQIPYNSFQPKNFNQPVSKINDRSVPAISPKFSVNNPNLSLDFNSKNQLEPKNQDNRISPIILSPKSQYTRPRHGDLAKSLILQQQTQIQIPEDILSPKKDVVDRNIRKKNHRGSEYNIQQSHFISSLNPKREDNTPLNNYGKGKFDEEQREKQNQAFQNRNDMKRSMVVQGTYERMQSPPPFLVQRKQSLRQKKLISCENFIKIKELGNGKYGKVSLVFEKYTGFICALKMIEKKLLHEEEITGQFLRQVKIQMFLNHPNIVKMYGFFEQGPNIYIILEVGTGGQLFHQIKKSLPLQQSKTAFIMKQVCQAVNQIHSNRIIHRDIKPENIVVHENVLKLCDFGWSVHQDNKLRTTFCGTPLYVCPEILKGNQYDQKIDIWSIGIMMYEMLVGQNPFKITKQEQLIKIVKDEVKIPSYLIISFQTRDFLDRCLQKNPQNRATIKQLINHQFFKKYQQKNEKSKSNDAC